MKNILLIDDDEIIQNVLMKILQQNGFNVVVGKDGREGLEKVEEMSFDLVISDIMMPYLNGFEFIESLKQHKHTEHAKVIVISSITHQDSINNSMNIGVDHYVPKPLVLDSFIALVHQILT